MAIHDWPDVLGARGISFNQRGMSVAGPPTLSGQSQVASYDAGYWIAALDVSTMAQGAQVKAFRSLRAKLAGGAHQIRVPVFDRGQAPWPVAGVYSAPPTDFTDDTAFSDGTAFRERVIKVVLAAAAALRATNISVTITAAATISGGEYFSIGDRLHVVQEVLEDGSWVIWPPLRAAAAAGTPLEFDAPVCRMRLASEQEMDLALGRLWQAQPSVAFIETP